MHDQQKSNGLVPDTSAAQLAAGDADNDVLGSPGGKPWRRMLAQGSPSSEDLAALLATLPQAAWSPILLDAQRDPRLGNRFVQNVLQLTSAASGAVSSAVTAKPGPSGDAAYPRPIARQKDVKADAGEHPAFQPLPVAGIKILDFTEGALIQEVNRTANQFRDLPMEQCAALALGWKGRIADGERSKSVAVGGAVGNVQVGYKNAVQRDDGSYVADVTWRIFLSHENGEGAVETVVSVGKISFTAQQPFATTSANKAGAARDVSLVPLAPPTTGNQAKGPITCHEGEPVNDKCFLPPSDRAEMLTNARDAIMSARMHFEGACEAERARLKASYDADQAFGMALVEMLFGFGMGHIMGAVAKRTGKVIAGKASTEMDLWDTRLPSQKGIADHAASTAEATKGASAALDVVGKFAAPGKKNLLDRLKPGIGSADALLTAIKDGSQYSFDHISQSLKSATDEELMLTNGAFLNATQASYVAMLQNYLPKFMKEVATLGEYDAPYSADFGERLVWAKDPEQGGKKRLARIREFHPNMPGALTVPDQPNRSGREMLGWVSDEMIPFALDRHKRIFGEVAVLP